MCDISIYNNYIIINLIGLAEACGLVYPIVLA